MALTASLGCQETDVDAYRLSGGDAISLPNAPENVCIPIDGAGELTADVSLTVPHRGVARIPAGVECQLQGDESGSWFVISASAESPPPGRMVYVPILLASRSTRRTVSQNGIRYGPASTAVM